MAAALAEAHRVLRPGGRLLDARHRLGLDRLALPDPTRMRRVLAAWDEHLVDPYLPRRLGPAARRRRLHRHARRVLPLLNTGYRADVYSAGLIGFVTGFVPGRDGLTDDEVAGLGR